MNDEEKTFVKPTRTFGFALCVFENHSFPLRALCVLCSSICVVPVERSDAESFGMNLEGMKGGKEGSYFHVNAA